MVTLSWFEALTLVITVGFGILNIIQFQRQRQFKRDTLKPIYNGLIGLFNDVKNKGTHCYTRQNLIFSKNSPYDNIDALKWNFYEFTMDSINHLQNLREHIVSILKIIDPSEKRVFREADFALTDGEKEARRIFQRSWQMQQEIAQQKLAKELQEPRKQKWTDDISVKTKTQKE